MKKILIYSSVVILVLGIVFLVGLGDLLLFKTVAEESNKLELKWQSSIGEMGECSYEFVGIKTNTTVVIGVKGRTMACE